MSRSDVYLYIDANDPADAVIASKTSTTAATFPTLVLGDTPTFNFYFTDGTNFASWAGDAGYSVTWALSDAIAGDQAPLALQTSATPITGGWSMVLPINTGALVNDLQSRRVSQAWPVVQLWSHIRITDDAGGLVSYAMIRTNVRLRAIGDTQTTPDDPLPAGTQFVLADETGALSSPANFLDASGFVTLAGTQEITGTKNFSADLIVTKDEGNALFQAKSYTSSNNEQAEFRGILHNGTVASPANVTDGQDVSRHSAYAYRNGAIRYIGSWSFYALAPFSTNYMSSRSVMHLTDNTDVHNNVMQVDYLGNIALSTMGTGLYTHGTDGQRVVALSSGDAPATSPANSAQFWVADFNSVGGQATFHFLTENGTVIRLNQDVSTLGTPTFARLNISNIPTSASGLSSGDVWSDGGTLKIVS